MCVGGGGEGGGREGGRGREGRREGAMTKTTTYMYKHAQMCTNSCMHFVYMCDVCTCTCYFFVYMHTMYM